MTSFQILTLTVSGLALFISTFGFIREWRRKLSADRVRTAELLDAAWLCFPDVENGDRLSRERFRSYLEIAERISPTDARLARYRGYEYEIDGDLANATHQFQIALRAKHDYGQAWLDLARVSRGTEKIRYLERAMKDPRVRTTAQVMMSEHYRISKNLPTARSTIHAALKVNLNRSDVNLEMGRVVQKMEGPDAALKYFERAVEFASMSDIGERLVDLGLNVVRQGDQDYGVLILERAVPLMSETSSVAHEQLAAIYADEATALSRTSRTAGKESAAKALHHLESALTRDPKKLLTSEYHLDGRDLVDWRREMRELVEDSPEASNT